MIEKKYNAYTIMKSLFFIIAVFYIYKTTLNYDITQGIMWKIKGIPSVS